MESLIPEAFDGRSALVTGGLGFIGSSVTVCLAQRKNLVTVVTTPRSCPPRCQPAQHWNPVPRPGRRREITVIRADLGEPAARAAAAEAELVFNLAGQVSHLDSMTDPLFDLDVNTRSQVALLEGLRHENPGCVVIFTSTRQLFGKPRYLPVDEDHPVAPVDVNGITKHATELFHLLYDELYGVASVVVRLTNVYGPRQRLRDDFQGFLPTFVRRALLGETLTVFGEGEQRRDCLYVDDVVDCLLRAAVATEAHGELFNVGNDENLSVREIADAVVAAADAGSVESVPWPEDRDMIDIGSYFGDSSKAKRVLGWTPKMTFAEGIDRTIEFYRDHRDWYL